MTCQFTVSIATSTGSIDLVSPMDWFDCHAAILAALGITDATPVTSAAQAEAISAKAVRAAAMPAKHLRRVRT